MPYRSPLCALLLAPPLLVACAGAPSAGAPAAAVPDAAPEPPSYRAWLEAGSTYVVGEQASVQAIVEAAGEYKCNEKYPYKFKPTAGDGVRYPSDVVADADKGLKRATIVVPFVPTREGELTVEGTYYFSVCTQQVCQIKKEPLSVKVHASAAAE